jgi:3-oxoacyl-[acyl-carrier-protein] synthase-3
MVVPLVLGKDKVVSNIEKYGNTSAGSVPIALAEAVEVRGGGSLQAKT